jgi:hypothetical protein
MVTSRATGDDLIEDADTQSADATAPPQQSSRTPAAAKPGSAKTTPPDDKQDAPAPAKDAPTRDVKANGGPAAKGAARPAPVDATVIDGIPALPADTIGSSRSTKPREPEAPATSFGPPPPVPAKPALGDPTIAYPAEAAAKPSGDTAAATAASGTAPSSGPTPTGSASTGSASSGTSSSASPAAETSSMPPAAFAWEMPDPPADSPSSPARAFLRSGLTAKNPPPAPPKTAPSAPPGKPAATGAPARGPAKDGPITLGQPRSGPAKGGTGPKAQQKAQQKAQSKKSARQAHLTISRVEPWSVMKFSFVVSLVAFVILFVAVSVLYGALSGLGVFDSLQRVVTSLTSSQGTTGVNAKAWFSASRVLGYTALLGSLNIVLITAMSTIGSVVYNLTSRLVGGVEVTLRETE